jgi:diguanylate cyclase (GGDEF)-like protein
MSEKPRKSTLMQLQVSLPKKIIITVLIMAALILLVYFFNIPNPNMILIAGLVLCSALFGYGGGIVAAAIMLGYTLFFFSTDNDFIHFTPQNTQKVIVSLIGIAADMLFVCALKRTEIREFEAVDELTNQLNIQKESLSSLLNHMPALSFYKDARTGVYLACNQAFADYARRKSPAEVVGLTDFEIFDPATAKHFVEDDKKALAMEEPYHFFEDVPDAGGSQKQFRTTKLKFTDETGRLCLLGMCMDVTEVFRIRKENEETQAAYQEALSTSVIYESILNALSGDYFDLYYVDLDTDEFIEYGSWTAKGQRRNEVRGKDFFREARKNALTYVYEEDREPFLERMDKDRLLEEIGKHGSYIYHYRLLIDGVPAYVSMKATRMDRHMIIGVSNVDTQVKDRMAAERAAKEQKSYLRLSALNGNLIVLYYVDLENGQYTEFSSSPEFKTLGIANQGSDFFRTTYENSLRTIHPEDQALFHAQVTKENITSMIRRNGVFVLDYRMMSGDLPTYVRLKAAKITEEGKDYLIIGLFDEDAQIRREQEYAQNLSIARRMATVDSLTGVKNKHAYAEWEEKMNTAIREGTQGPFAVVVCDINNLKAVNDLYGHKVGDECIRNGCMKICHIFDHSPVFRVGGDEFVVLLTGKDYSRRKELMEQVNAVPSDPSQIRIGETIAAGMAEYKKNRHESLQGVFEDADRAMYEKKQLLKESLQAADTGAGSVPNTEYIPEIHTRKHLLIVDDVEMNREILGDLLEDEYDITYAGNGNEALETLRSRKDEIDLMLLDLLMPEKNGREVLAEMQVDEDLRSIPVIILTVDQQAELDCLKIGAMDFIPKPYPDIEIVKARISKCIELSEDRELIRHTERDKLTGLLNKDYFLRYVSRLDHLYKDSKMDAVVCDVSRFHSVNKQYGREFGDNLLRNIGLCMKKIARKTGGISCREGGDTFLLYCLHQEDYEQLMKESLADLYDEKEIADPIRVRVGVFADARQTADVEERFNRAMIAADSVKDNPRKMVGFYDL